MASDTNSFKIPVDSSNNSFSLSSLDIRSLILNDNISIQCLFKLYQFYEFHSESVDFILFYFVFYIFIVLK